VEHQSAAAGATLHPGRRFFVGSRALLAQSLMKVRQQSALEFAGLACERPKILPVLIEKGSLSGRFEPDVNPVRVQIGQSPVVRQCRLDQRPSNVVVGSVRDHQIKHLAGCSQVGLERLAR